jgi:pyridoxamine 5'-phosphate oxidase
MSEKNPIKRFETWFEEAKKSETSLPEAMSLSTVSKDGQPSSRMVLLKEFDENGFVFYTNKESRKGRELQENGRAALLFHWKTLQRQVRIAGTVSEVPAAQADAYYATRPRGAQIGAWASRQSRAMEGRFDLEKEVARFTAKFGAGAIERPPFWTGFQVMPLEMEFWREGRFRLHRREFYIRDGDRWRIERLYP